MDRLAKTQAPKAETSLQTEVAKIVSDVVGATAEGKKLARNLTVEVKEYQFTSSDKKAVNALVVYLPFVFVQNQRALIPKLVNEIQKKKNRHTFVLAKRTIVNPKAAYKQRIPRSRTLTAVYDALLEDLIYPANVIGRRFRFRINGSMLAKVFVSDESQAFLADKTDLITQLYFALTNRKIAFEFRPEASFIQIPKLRAPKKTARAKTTA